MVKTETTSIKLTRKQYIKVGKLAKMLGTSRNSVICKLIDVAKITAPQINVDLRDDDVVQAQAIPIPPGCSEVVTAATEPEVPEFAEGVNTEYMDSLGYLLYGERWPAVRQRNVKRQKGGNSAPLSQESCNQLAEGLRLINEMHSWERYSQSDEMVQDEGGKVAA